MQNWARKNAVLFKPRQNCWSWGRCYIISIGIMAKWRFCLVVMMGEVDDVRWGGVNGLSFWSLESSSEASTSDMLIFWVWAMRNQWLWAHLSPSMLRESRERSVKRQSSWNSLIHWVPDAFLVGRMAEKGDRIATMDGGYVVGKIWCVVEGWRWRWWRGGWVGDVIYEKYPQPVCARFWKM